MQVTIRVIWGVHKRLMHLGVQKTLATLRLDFFWSGMSGDVQHTEGVCAMRSPNISAENVLSAFAINWCIPDK